MSPNSNLYHYTSAEALLGIIGGGSIWASNINYLNDEKEYLYTVELLRPHLEKLQSNTKNRALLDQLIRWIEKAEGGPTYVTSLSSQPDILSQWRAYCRNGGFSIGFTRDGLQEIVKRCGVTLTQCVYDYTQQSEKIASFIDGLAGAISSKGQKVSDRKDAHQFYADYVYKQLILLANEIKHPAFQEEEEWRLVKLFVPANDPNLKYRAGNAMLVPYFEIDLLPPCERKESFPPISDIGIGPHRNSKLSETTLRAFLAGQTAGYSDSPHVKVWHSTAPFREI